MKPSVSLDRREFTLQSALALLGGVTITVSGCGGGGSGYSAPSNPTGPNPASGDRGGVVSANHGHVATITSAQMTGGSTIVLNIQGIADHNHTVELTAADLGSLGGGTTVVKTTSNAVTDGHQHTVTFSPGQAPVGPSY